MDRTIYRIRVRGALGPEWADWFDGLTVEQTADGLGVLSGSLPDQAALHGVLARIRDLGLPLVSVETSDGDREARAADGAIALAPDALPARPNHG